MCCCDDFYIHTNMLSENQVISFRQEEGKHHPLLSFNFNRCVAELCRNLICGKRISHANKATRDGQMIATAAGRQSGWCGRSVPINLDHSFGREMYKESQPLWRHPREFLQAIRTTLSPFPDPNSQQQQQTKKKKNKTWNKGNDPTVHRHELSVVSCD